MGQIIDSEGRICEGVGWHSRQKHAFLEAYLNIWSEQVGTDGKSRQPTLDIFDLYASSGWCHCTDKKETWKGSSLLAAECLTKYQNGRLLFLNTYGLDQDETTAQKKALETSLINLQLPKRINYLIETLPIDKAVDEAIKHAKPNYPNLWILDPYKPQDLPWSIVEKICKLEGSYKKGKYNMIRRPELFINLMTSTLQRETGIDYLKDDWVGISLGMKKEEWESKLKKFIGMGKNRREALILMYAEKISNFYKKPPIILEVPSNDGAIVYTIFLCTDNNAGHYVMKLLKLPAYKKWLKIEWEKSAETISEKKRERRKDEKLGLKPRFLDEFDEDKQKMGNLQEPQTLPEGWEWKRLGDVANIIMGQSPPGSTYNENGYGFSFLQGNAEFGDKFPKHVKYTTEPSKIAPKGSVLISVRAPVGDINLANMDYCIGRGLASILLVKGDNNFLFYLLNYLKPKIEDKGTGSTFKAVSKSILNEIQIPLPPLSTQRRIVSILEKAEETKKIREQADELTDGLLQSVFMEMFGDPVRNPKGWNTADLGVYCSFLTSGSRGWAKFYSKEGAKFVRVQNLTGHRLSFEEIAFITPPDTTEAKRTKVKPKDLLISITGLVGLVAIVPEDIGDAYVSQHVAIVRLREGVDSKFLAKFLAFPNGGQHQIMKRQYGQTKPGIGLEDIRTISIFVPPLPLQQQFARLVEKVEAMRQSQAQSKQQIENLFNTMIQKAFQGEWT